MSIGVAIPARKSDGARARVTALVSYILHLEGALSKDHQDDKVLFSGSENFAFNSERSQMKEMIALASRSKRSKDPIFHLMISLEEGEKPTREQAKEMVRIALKQFGMSSHQCIWAVHQDTKNIHLHMVLNRVNPESEKCLEINKGFYKEAVQQIAALIDYAQGWKHTAGTRYSTDADGNLIKLGDKPDRKALDKSRLDMEVRTGQKSAQRVGIEAAMPIISGCTSWAELHEKLAEVGMRYERQGSGAVIHVGETVVKASSVDRKAAFGALQKKLGEYQASTVQVLADPDKVQDLHIQPMPGAPASWHDYAKTRREHFAAKAGETAITKAAIDSRYTELLARQKLERAEKLQGSWSGKGAGLNAARSMLAAKHAAEKADLKDLARADRAALRAKFKSFPAFEEWLKAEVSEQAGEDWRYRLDVTNAEISGQAYKQPVVSDIRSFHAQAHGPHVDYFDASGHRAFCDTGRTIYVHSHDDASILAAMQLAQQKFGFINIKGDAEFKKQCLQVALANGLKLKNPELQAEQNAALAARKERYGQRFDGRPGPANGSHSAGEGDRAGLAKLAGSRPEFTLRPEFRLVAESDAGRPGASRSRLGDAFKPAGSGVGSAFRDKLGSAFRAADAAPVGPVSRTGTGDAAVPQSSFDEVGPIREAASNPVHDVQGSSVDAGGDRLEILVQSDAPGELGDVGAGADRGLRRAEHDGALDPAELVALSTSDIRARLEPLDVGQLEALKAAVGQLAKQMDPGRLLPLKSEIFRAIAKLVPIQPQPEMPQVQPEAPAAEVVPVVEHPQVLDPVIEAPKKDLLAVFESGGHLDYPERVAVEKLIHALPGQAFKAVKARFESAFMGAKHALQGAQKVLSEKEGQLKVLQVADVDGSAALAQLVRLGHIKTPGELQAFGKRTAKERVAILVEVAGLEKEIAGVKVAIWTLPGLQKKLAKAQAQLKAKNDLGGVLSKALRRPTPAVVKQAVLEFKEAEIQVARAGNKVNHMDVNLQPIVLRIERQHAEAEKALALEAEKARKMEALRGSKSVARPSNLPRPKG